MYIYIYIVLETFMYRYFSALDIEDANIIEFVFTNCFLFKVQSKVSLKYDSWHKEVLSKFGSLLGNEMVDFHSAISKVNQFKFSSCTYIKIHTCV